MYSVKYTIHLRWVAGKKMITLEEKMKKMSLGYIDSKFIVVSENVLFYILHIR